MRRRSRPGDPLTIEVLAKAFKHPVRVKALSILTDRTAGPKEIAHILDRKLSNVSYHVRVLEELGLIELVEEENVRGSVAHFYKIAEPDPAPNKEWTALGPQVRKASCGRVVDALLSDLAGSISAGLIDRRDDRLLNRTPLWLDEAGWKNVRQIQASALEQILQEQAAAVARMDGSHDGVARAVIGQLFFEVPQEGPEDA